MTDKLPPNLLQLFAPRPPLRYLQPSDHASEKRHTAPISGIAQFLPALEEYKKEDVYKPTESWLQRRDRVKVEKQTERERLITGAPTLYKPAEDPKVQGDAFKTLFVGRLSYDTEVKDLEREFGRFGEIDRIRIIYDTTKPVKSNSKNKKNSRGYAFIVYEKERDMKAAYKETDGIRIKDRRVLVDVERGRTVVGWRPRRFGGGLGGRGYTKAAPPRPMGPGFGGPPMGPGGFRGGFGGGRGGGFRGGFGGDRGPGGGFRGGFGGGGRGGGGFGGDRPAFGNRGVGYQSNGFAAPEGAPSGPRGPRGGSNGGGYGDRGSGGGRFDDRGSGSNREPIQPRGSGGYRDRDKEGAGHDRKRPYDGDGYQDPRSKRRY